METQINFSENKYRTLNSDPQYFGGYLNMARMNIFSISNHIANDFGLPLLRDDGEIKNVFLCDKKNKKLNWNHAYTKTKRFLHILKVFDFESLPKTERESITNLENTGKNFAEMADTLKFVFGELQEFRNDYSHFYSTEKGTQRKLNVSGEMANFLKINYNRAIEYTRDRFQGVFIDEDFNLAYSKRMVENDNTITTEGLVFLTCIFLEREYAFQFIGKITGLKGTQYNSFLATREVLMAFCVSLPHEKFMSDDTRQAFTLDIINDLNRCPKTLYNVITEEEKQLFRPKLDELKVNNLLENSTNAEDDVEDYDEYIEALTKQVRHSDRFGYFALKFIDEAAIFSKFRFHVDLGKFVLDEYPKMLNGIEEDRRIIENVKAFGKLSSFQNVADIVKIIENNINSLGFEQFAPHFNMEINKIGISLKERTALLTLKINNKGEKKQNLLQPHPDAFLSIHELTKIILLDYLKKSEPEKLINDFLLINNTRLMNKEFIDEVKSKLPDNWDEFKKKTDSRKKSAYSKDALNYLLMRKETLNQVLSAYNLNVRQIPSRILDYWLQIKDVEKKQSVSDRIKLIKRDCMDKLKSIEKFKTERKGKIPKIGEMATFLAKDIVDMIISKEKKSKITSFYYDKMQECLALYADPSKKQLFIDMVNNDLKLYDTGGHPFLNEINLSQIRYTSDLYEKYLQAKGKKMVKVTNSKTGKINEIDKSWMATTFYFKEWNEKAGKQLTVVKLPENKSNIPFTLCQLEDKNSSALDQWLYNVTHGKESSDGKKPVNLPTNLFDETLELLLCKELDELSVPYQTDANYNELLKIWWQSRKDDTQGFYKAEREYQVFDETVRFIPNSKERFADYYQKELVNAHKKKQQLRTKEKLLNRHLPDIEIDQVEKSFKQAIANTEKEIRILQEQDRILLLMLEKLIGNDNNLNLKLNEINTLLNDTTLITQKVNGKLSFDDAGELIRNKANPEITKVITTERKRKNYSILRKFIFDRRLPELFEYYDKNEIPLDQLKDELDAYNKAKHIVTDKVFELEERIIKRDENGVKQYFVDDKGQIQTGNIPHKAYLFWLKNSGFINIEEFRFLNMVRNCFSHNQFPQKKTMVMFIKSWDITNISMQIAEAYNRKIEYLISRL